MIDCVFCKIVKGEIPSYKVYEDEDFYALLDIKPHTKGHTLVIPKQHYRWVYEVPNFQQYWSVVLKTTKALQKALNPMFITYVTHGLEIEHAHIHIMPRYPDDISYVPDEKSFTKEEFLDIAESIRDHL